MPERSQDWLRQADADLRHARGALQLGDHEWSAFASQQAAENATKALYRHLHMEAWGHVLTQSLEKLPAEARPDDALLAHAKQLDKNYILPRYPNGFESGAPVDFFATEDAMTAIAHAETIIEFCKNILR